nr:hypothetical protein BCU29_11265 [Vibrio lentus]
MNLTMNTQEVTLGEYITLQSGYAFSSALFSAEGSKLITPKNFTKSGRASFTQSNTKYTTEESSIKYTCRKGDLLMLLTDLTPDCRLLGKPVVLEEDEDVLLNQRIVKVSVNENTEIDKGYLLQFFLTDKWKRRMRITATGTTVRHSSNKIVLSTILSMPNLTDQQKIASFLSKVDEKIGLLSEKKDKLTEYKRGVMQQLFNGKWHEQDGQLTFIPPTLRFKADAGSEFPDWEEVQLGSLTSVMQSGISRQLSSDDIGYPILRSNNLYKGKVSFEDIKYWHLNDDQGADLTRYVLSHGDVLVNFINSLSQIGKVAIFQDLYGRDVIYTTNIMRLKFKASMISKFAFYSFNTSRYVNFIQSIAKPAVSQASFTTVDFKKYKMHLPVLAEQEKIISFLSVLDQKIDLTNSELNKAKEWKKGLLQQMFV